MGDVLDLDAARAAAGDNARTPLEVTFGGKAFQVSRPLPIGAAIALAEGDFRTAVTLMFGKKADQILKAGLDILDLKVIADRLIGGPGE